MAAGPGRVETSVYSPWSCPMRLDMHGADPLEKIGVSNHPGFHKGNKEKELRDPTVNVMPQCLTILTQNGKLSLGRGSTPQCTFSPGQYCQVTTLFRKDK